MNGRGKTTLHTCNIPKWFFATVGFVSARVAMLPAMKHVDTKNRIQ